MKRIICLFTGIISLFAAPSFAELSVGGYGGLNQAYPYFAGPGSASGKPGSEFGAVLLIPFLPDLAWRLGLAQKTRNSHYDIIASDSNGATLGISMDASETLVDFVAGAQWNLPVTGFYLLGGAKVTSSQRIACAVSISNINAICPKSKTDFPAFVGVGYNFFNTSLVHLGVEGEYAAGSSASIEGSRMSDLTGRLMVQIEL